MNYTNFVDAFNLDHVKQNTYTTKSIFNPMCIYCSNKQSIPLMADKDGGAFRLCTNNACRKQFRANIMSAPLPNYISATDHLKSTH